jgi:hypothetical protein
VEPGPIKQQFISAVIRSMAELRRWRNAPILQAPRVAEQQQLPQRSYKSRT